MEKQMAVSANEFWQQITRIGIFDAATCRAWIDRFRAVVSKRAETGDARGKISPDDATTVAQFLVANRVLTKFQSQRLLAGRAGELRISDYLVVDRCETPPLSRWYFGRRLGSSTPCLIYPCTDALTSARWVDTAWLKAHGNIVADGLQPITIVTLADPNPWRGAIISEIGPGRPLSQWAAEQGPLDHSTVTSIGQLLAASLAVMHQAGMVHGEVRPSRIWCGEDRSLWLLRDAGRPPSHPLDPPQEHRWFDDDSSATHYAAPELSSIDSPPSPSSDLYALGAVMFELATGRRLKPTEKAAEELPIELAVAREEGAAGDPLMRTLAFAVDPDPASRFPDVSGFSRALTAVQLAYETQASEQIAAPEPPSPEPPSLELEAPRVVAQVAPKPIDPRNPANTPKPIQAQPPPEEPSAAPEPKRPVRRRTRRTPKGPIIIGSVAVAILLGIFAVLLRPSSDEVAAQKRPPLPLPPPRVSPVSSPTSAVNPSTNAPWTTGTGGTSTTENASSGYELVQDDRLLWAAPWPPKSTPPSLEMIPPGSQLIATFRLNRLVGDTTSEWFDWMGAELKPALQKLEQRSGVKAADVERLTIAMSSGGHGWPRVSYTITTRDVIDVGALSKVWDASASRTRDGKTIYSGDDPAADTYYLEQNEVGARTFVFGPVELISLVAENDGASIPLARSLQQLWDMSSADADVVAMVIPNFIFADGREILRQYAPNAVDPLRQLLIPDAAGAVVSMAVVDRWYVETRLTPSGTVSAPAMLQTLQPRIESLPAWAESFAIDANVDPSWRAMAIRLPQFMRAVVDQTRFGVSETIPTFNFYLPSEAAPQFLLATTLALAAVNNGPAAAVMETTPTVEQMTVDQMLDTKLSISFDQESLQFAVGMIRDEFARSLPKGVAPPAINIIGGDLEKMGITQNQQIRDFKMEDKPLREALTELARQANPDKTVTALTEQKQSLIWVVDRTAPPTSPTILITTRQAAEVKKTELPPEFKAG
jgi:serine/threonine protein kinase